MNNTFGINIIPDNDQERIAALKRYKILDTPSEESFDNIAKLGTEIFDVPISLVSLVDEENVFFKANAGMGTATKSSRGVSLCALGILEADITVFEDALETPCLLANPLVAGDFGLKFYAGAPLVTHDGFKIGTICIVDKKPRSFTKKDELVLKRLAKITMDAIELRLSAINEVEQQKIINERLAESEANAKLLSENLAAEVKEQALARKRIEAAEQRMESMVMNSNIGMSIFKGRDLVIEVANEPMYAIWGRTPQQALNKPLLEVFPELQGQAFPEMLDNIFVSGKPWENKEIPVELKTETGTKNFFINVKYVPLFDENENVELVVATVINITEIVQTRKLLEETNEELAVTMEEIQASNEELIRAYDDLKIKTEQLGDSESRFRSMIDQSPVAMMVTRGEDHVVDMINPIMLQILGNKQDILGQPLFDTFEELRSQGFKEIIYNVYATGKPFYSFDNPVTLLIDGKEQLRYFDLAYTPIREEGEINSVLQVAIEVTDQIANLEKLKNAEEMLRLAIEAANVGTWHIDLQTWHCQTSAGLKRLYGCDTNDEMVYPDNSDQIPAEHRQRVLDAVDETIQTGKPYNVEYPVMGLRDGQLRWLKASGKINHNIRNTSSYFSGVAIDITEQKQDELRKNDFIAMVSHELKTPLTSLKGYMQVLIAKNKANKDNFTFTALEKGSMQITKMTKMIDGFLNLSQMEAGKIYLRKSDFLISDLVKEIVDDFKLVTVTHLIVISSESTARVEADRDKIGQVITNFLSNAIKYSTTGTVIAVYCEATEHGIKISVKDEGNGISKEDCKRLFERFYRVANPSRDSIAGFGIGLYICAEIIERHDGRIWVESKKGIGSIFNFSLPTSIVL